MAVLSMPNCGILGLWAEHLSGWSRRRSGAQFENLSGAARWTG